ncbi:NAD-binding protein [Phellopilus nigrolimitatus]|nr:NAD-binding protein [Phellopilus nigrolimitatus]
MASFIGLLIRNIKINNPPEVEKKADALRCGILGAARIAPVAIILPSKSHPDVTIVAAETFARKHSIPKTYSGRSGYQDMLDDQEIDIIYNPLPNGLHYEWTLKALNAGKHVLLEKPSTDTESETRFLFAYARHKGLVLLEAFHSRFHPAINRVKEIVASNELGKLKNVSATLCAPWQMRVVGDDDIRYRLELGGGILMDMGCYPLAMVRYVTSAEPTSIMSAQADVFPNPRDDPSKRNIDTGTSASLTFPNDVTASIECHALWHGWGPFGLFPRVPDMKFVATCEGGTVELFNYVMPHSYHSITVTPSRGKRRVEKAYTYADGLGEDWWSSYRYQLEFFVDKVRGREPRLWMEGDDSVSNMEWIEKIYEKTGLGSRPKSDFVLSE